MLNPREQALVIWLIIFIIFALSIKGVRESIPSIIKSLLGLLIHPIFIITNSYIILVFFTMYLFKILEVQVIKDYILWIFMALYPLISRVSSRYIEENINKLIVESFKLSIIPLFIINEYTLSIWAELVIIPILVLIGGLIAAADRDERYLQVKKLLNYMLMIIGFIFIFVAFKGFSSSLQDATKIDFYEKMFIDIIGILLHAPLLFLLQYMCLYEHIIVRTNINKRSKKILAIVIIFLECRFNKKILQSNLKNYKLRNVETMKDLKIILQVKSEKS
ncbi:hypothetical protein EHS13_25035 [Paenibacillus psychroresistens]|uniref:Uncharacterized protein n=1 Tax=Paenibacillus psychroresistens TaxID=1778678 RepID=A0A6B8RPH0_9BACL|nr:hypothetical protein [Paenibacillus psychroresistens]QGQ97919.1 hypothetical protein EHS13_25035 [Paenibacillus psychroresistens]